MKIFELHLYEEIMFIDLDSIHCVRANYDGHDIPNITDFNFKQIYEIKMLESSEYTTCLKFSDYETFNSCLKAILIALKSKTGLAFYDYYYEEIDKDGNPVNDSYNVIKKDGNLYEV